MSLMMRKALTSTMVFAMVSVVFSTVPMVAMSADPVILKPGYIYGTMTIDGETVDHGRVWVYDANGVDVGFDAHAYDGDYWVPVEGNNDYAFLPVAVMYGSSTGYESETNISLPFQDVSVDGEYVDGEWVPDYVELDVGMTPGYIDATVTVTEGNIEYIRWMAHCRPNTYYDRVYVADKRENGLYEGGTQYYLSGSTTIPAMPWGADTNGDGVIDNSDDTHYRMRALVCVDGTTFTLPFKYFGVAVGETTTVSWTLDVDKGTISGYVDIGDDDPTTEDYPYTYRINGEATIAESPVALVKAAQMDPRYPWNIPIAYEEYWSLDADDPYSMEIFAGDYDLFPEVHFYDPSSNLDTYLSMRGNPTAATVYEDQETEVNFDLNPSFVEGTVNLNGVEPYLDWIVVRGDIPQTSSTYFDAWTITHTNDYRLILNPDSWYVGAPSVSLFFDHDLTYKARAYGTSYIHITDSSIRGVEDPITLEAGETVTGVDFSYDIAQITLKYLIEGGGVMGLEEIRGYQNYGEWPSGINYNFIGHGIPATTEVGECTCVIPAGLNHIEARAYVDGANTLFGQFWIDVDAGDVIVSDIGAPIVDITTPTGLQHVTTSTVEVTGTATDDTGVETITVNGVEVGFTSTNNPEDPNEVAFTTTVSGLTLGENTITVVAYDGNDRSSSVERIVIMDNDAPVIDSFAVSPGEPVKLGDLTTVTAEVSDPNEDALTTTISWGDGTSTETTDESIETTHEYETAGVYTVTLSVTDGVYTTVAVYRYVVVYDPDGGFVTGGGWIVSPEGAYVADETLNGKANFGFVSKYKKGADVPTGNVEFQFKVGDLNFHSSDFEWLVVAGSKAKFKGTGTINGEGNYGFMISAIDGADNGDADTFRIKIWDKDADDAVVYDNQMDADDDDDPTTELQGGNIVVHKGDG